MSITLPKWYDLHAHFRQEELLPATVKDHIAMGCAGALAMPNTKPPLTAPELISTYRDDILRIADGAFQDVIVPLYLSAETTPKMIEKAAGAGTLRAAKYYPPHGTTGAQAGQPFESYIDNGVFAAMEAAGVVLCIHGEQHALPGERYFDRKENAEEIFYRENMPRLIEKFPKLKIVGEHLTTKIGVDFIQNAPDHVKASITPQHLLYTIGHLLKGLNYHLYCLPLVKYEDDRAALREAVTDPNNTKFFAGTDSAPHTEKTTPCGCAAGCYTGGIAPQLYAQAFEEAGANPADKAFENFLCHIGRAFYGLPAPEGTFMLEKMPQTIEQLEIGVQKITPLPLGLGAKSIPWSIKTDQ